MGFLFAFLYICVISFTACRISAGHTAEYCTIKSSTAIWSFILPVFDMVTVMHEGKVLMEGDIDSILGDETVQKVYLGRGGERNAED